MSWATQKIRSWTSGLVMKSLLSGLAQTSAMYSGYAGDTAAGVSINHANAESITAFFTCLRIKYETIASLTTTVQHIEGEKSTRDRKHPVDRLVSIQSSKTMNAHDFWQVMQYMEDLWGNAFAYIDRNQVAKPTQLMVWFPWDVQVRRDASDGSIWYVHKGKAYPQRDVLHFKQNSSDGIVGRSILTVGREKLGLAKKQENYAAKVYGERPPAVFEDGAGLTTDQALAIAQGFKDHTSKGLTPMVWGGLKYKPIMMPPGDAQLFESLQTTKGDIAGLFRMPLKKLQSYSREQGGTYNNIEQQEIAFVRDVVIPSVKSKVIECNTKLFSSSEQGSYEVEFDMSELLKGDIKTEKELIESMLTRGVYTINDARKRLNENPVDDGDRRFIQAGFIPLDRVDDFIDGDNPVSDKKLKDLLNGQKVN